METNVIENWENNDGTSYDGQIYDPDLGEIEWVDCFHCNHECAKCDDGDPNACHKCSEYMSDHLPGHCSPIKEGMKS